MRVDASTRALRVRRLGVVIIVTFSVTIGLWGCRVASTGYVGQAPQAQCLVRFSPNGGCTQLIVDTIAQAKRTILVQAYSCTSKPIASALIGAHHRGVVVDVLLDKSQRTERACVAELLAEDDIPVRIDAAHAIAHNKVMIIDGETVITGSFNFTESAEERNAENLLVIHDSTLAQRYSANWSAHAAHAQPYARKHVGNQVKDGTLFVHR